MANDGVKITGKVNILADLRPVLGTIEKKLGRIVRYANINKWALYKPIINPATNFDSPSARQAAIAAARAGFGTTSQKQCPKILKQSFLLQGGGISYYSEQECLEEVMEWGPYLRPAGHIHQQPFREKDFQNYNHAAIAPDRWLNKSLTLAQLTEIAGSNISVQGSRGSHIFVPGITTALHEGVRCAITAESSGRISPDANMEIPIATITGELVENNDWRMSLAVWLPSRNEWAIFPSRKNIHSCVEESHGGTPSANIFPDFGCNPAACGVILSEYNAGRRTWDMVPIFVKNIGATVDSAGKNTPCLVNDASVVYCMPSGTKTIALEVQSGKQKKYFILRSVQGSSATKKTWYLKNTDTTKSHIYTVHRTVRNMSVITNESYTDTTIGANTEVNIGTDVPYDMYGINVSIEVSARDNIPVSELED